MYCLYTSVVLCTINTNPVALIKDCIWLITCSGSFTGHAAITPEEFVPSPNQVLVSTLHPLRQQAMTPVSDHLVITFVATPKTTQFTCWTSFLFDHIVKTLNPLKWTFACFLVIWHQARFADISHKSQVTFNYNKLKNKQKKSSVQFSSPKQKYKKYS